MTRPSAAWRGIGSAKATTSRTPRAARSWWQRATNHDSGVVGDVVEEHQPGQLQRFDVRLEVGERAGEHTSRGRDAEHGDASEFAASAVIEAVGEPGGGEAGRVVVFDDESLAVGLGAAVNSVARPGRTGLDRVAPTSIGVAASAGRPGAGAGRGGSSSAHLVEDERDGFAPAGDASAGLGGGDEPGGRPRLRPVLDGQRVWTAVAVDLGVAVAVFDDEVHAG